MKTIVILTFLLFTFSNLLLFANATQRIPCISTDGSGNFIIAWEDDRNGTYNFYAQRYSSGGTALGNNFQVNDVQSILFQTTGSCISADDSGNFIIAWKDGRNGKWCTVNWDVYAQRYSSDGTAQGSSFRVNDDQDSTMQGRPSISANSSGNFVITWHDGRNGNVDIYAQRYSSHGTALGNNFRINDVQGSPDPSTFPSISADNSGNFIITWGDGRNGNSDIYAQRYSSDGTALGSNFKVSDDTGSALQGLPSISADGNGHFIITFLDLRNGDDDIYAQRYSSDGTAIGSNFLVNDAIIGTHQFKPCISVANNGNFVITWEDTRDGNIPNLDVYAQLYLSDGTPVGSNFKVNDDICSDESYNRPSVSTDSSGNFIITFVDGCNDDGDIYAQRYLSDGTPVGSNFRVNDDPMVISEDELYRIPSAFNLQQNYPNPFNPSTTIEFDLPKSSEVILKVFNLLGEEVATLVSDRLSTGSYSYEWDASDLASGVYLYRLQAGEYIETRKMVLMR